MKWYLGFFTLMFACAGGGKSDPDGGGPKPDPDARAIIDAAPSPDADVPSTECTCVALTTDGKLSAVNLPSLAVETNVAPGSVANSGAVVRAFDKRVYVVNHDPANSVSVVNPVNWSMGSFSTGLVSNPRDIAVRGNRAYVAVLDAGELQIWNFGNGAPTQDLPVPMSPFDNDGNPDSTSVAIAGDMVFVSFSYLSTEGFPLASGDVFSMTLPNEQLNTVADLSLGTPASLLHPRGSDVVISTTGVGDTNGCGLDVLDTGTFSTCAAFNDDLGGFVTAIAPADDGFTYLTVELDAGGRSLRRVSDTDQLEAGSLTVAGQAPSDVSYCAATKQLAYIDQTGGGLRVLDVTTSTEVTTGAIGLGGPPAVSGGLTCFGK